MRTSSKDIFSQWFTHWYTKQWYFCKFNGFPLILLLLFLVLKMIFVTLTMFLEKNCQKERLEANGIKIQKKKIADSKSTGRGSSRNACAHSHVVHSPDFLFFTFLPILYSNDISCKSLLTFLLYVIHGAWVCAKNFTFLKIQFSDEIWFE